MPKSRPAVSGAYASARRVINDTAISQIEIGHVCPLVAATAAVAISGEGPPATIATSCAPIDMPEYLTCGSNISAKYAACGAYMADQPTASARTTAIVIYTGSAVCRSQNNG